MLLLEFSHRDSDLLANDEDSIFGGQTIAPAMRLVDVDQVDGRRVILQQTKAWTTADSSWNMKLEVPFSGLLLARKGTIGNDVGKFNTQELISRARSNGDENVPIESTEQLHNAFLATSMSAGR